MRVTAYARRSSRVEPRSVQRDLRRTVHLENSSSRVMSRTAPVDRQSLAAHRRLGPALDLGRHARLHDSEIRNTEGMAMHHKVAQAIEYIEINFAAPFTMSELARIIEVTPQHLCFLFRRHLAISPKQHLKRLRLRAARDLLERTSMEIKEVAYTVGYRDPSRFMRDFKRAHERTPAQYRAEILEGKAVSPPPLQSSIPLANLNFRHLILLERADTAGVYSQSLLSRCDCPTTVRTAGQSRVCREPPPRRRLRQPGRLDGDRGFARQLVEVVHAIGASMQCR